MCGRFLLATRPDIVVERFDARIPFDFGPRYNIAPGQISAILKQDEITQFDQAKWGLKLRTTKPVPPAINIRVESIRDKKGWINSLKTRRCIIPATGFYEWRKGIKQPYHITIKDDPIFSFAGLFQFREEEGIFAFAIITMEAPKELQFVHHRAPRIFDKENEKNWLDENLSLQNGLDLLLSPLQKSWLIKPASVRVNKVSNDDPSIIESCGEQSDLGFN